ncbi:MAG: hypothetical protein KIT44_09355 [Opitutaceae bacterium]|nr:hypothetical protein [Opitutaceae bacterium]
MLFVLAMGFHFWGITVGWQSRNLPGGEFRQAQTALSTYWIMQEGDFSPAYPTPVLGAPWSIPMEFPLYQWTVVLTSKVTGWGITKAGRAVSIACFYLTLPAVFLLLHRWQVAPARRWLVLALILTCPLYVFYTRGFLIETMALMFSVWFWVAFERAVGGRQAGWLAVAILAGCGAGLVKVTTFMLYLLPAGIWALARLWRNRHADWRTDFAWMAAAVAAPFAATLAWLRFADATKALNVLGSELTSASLREFNLGTTASRFSPELWLVKTRIVLHELTWWPAVLVCLLLVPLAGRCRWRQIVGCLLLFLSVLVIFPVLYAHHDYYYVANTLLLMLAMGLVLVALAESAVPRWLLGLAVMLVLSGQAWRYTEHYYPAQRAVSAGGDWLTRSLQTVTAPEDVILVLGQDWSSITPYYARRRAVMFRDHVARDPERVEQALAALEGYRIGALVIVGEPDGRQWLIDRAAVRGLAREPLYLWRDARVYVQQTRWNELLHAVLEARMAEVRLAPGVDILQENIADRWVETASLRVWQQEMFAGMTPVPVRFFSTFGPALGGSRDQPLFGAHPVTRLVFALPAGDHALRASLQLPLDAYRLDLPDADASDGVEVTLSALVAGAEPRTLATRHFNPRANREDRGTLRPLEFRFHLPEAGEVELFFGPGPAGRDTRDWIQLGPLQITRP